MEYSIGQLYIISDIDTADILSALEYHDLKPTGVFTSEDAKSYKPRKEVFQLALQSAGLKCDEVVHIGDSLNSDVKKRCRCIRHKCNMGEQVIERCKIESFVVIGNLLEAYSTYHFK